MHRLVAAAPRLAAALLTAVLVPGGARAQGRDSLDVLASRAVRAAPAPPAPVRKAAWYDRLTLRGYAQVRYNRLLETNARLACQQCDRSIGDKGGFLLRRGRLILSGDVHPRVSVYIQPDYGSEVAGSLHVLQLRDAWFDLHLDRARRHRVRLGQSKIPFGFENMQSSSDRLPLDRADPLNSALPNERDLGVIYYFASTEARRRFSILTDSGLKGSGDYGVLGLGVYNGQTANRPEQNNSLHAVAHLTYPFRLGNGQFVEASVHAYRGRFVTHSGQRTAGVGGGAEWIDERVAGTLVVYPQPFGLQAEWNVGRGPAFDATRGAIRTRRLEGGYVQVMARLTPGRQVVTPFSRAQRYRGGKKLETDARAHDVVEVESGVEWLPIPAFELTASWVHGDRRTADGESSPDRQRGSFARLQAQFNY